MTAVVEAERTPHRTAAFDHWYRNARDRNVLQACPINRGKARANPFFKRSFLVKQGAR